MEHLFYSTNFYLKSFRGSAEILNQQFKIYTSLSQTHSDVKMVQSLVPIWEVCWQLHPFAIVDILVFVMHLTDCLVFYYLIFNFWGIF